jgi:hypothetical protein
MFAFGKCISRPLSIFLVTFILVYTICWYVISDGDLSNYIDYLSLFITGKGFQKGFEKSSVAVGTALLISIFLTPFFTYGLTWAKNRRLQSKT